MPLRSHAIGLLLVSVAALAAPLRATPACARAAHFVFTGSVVEPGGRPVRDAQVLLLGRLEPAAVTDAEGRFAFTCDVPDLAAPGAATLRFALHASRRGWNLALPSGAATLVVELTRVRAPDGGPRLEVRSNEAAVAKAVALALGAAGDATVALDGRFTRLVGKEDRAEPALTALETVALAAEPERTVAAAPFLSRGPAPVAAAPADTAPAAAIATRAPSASRSAPSLAPPTASASAPAPAPRLAPPSASPFAPSLAPPTASASATVPEPRLAPPSASSPAPPLAPPSAPPPARPSSPPERPESMRLFPSAPDRGAPPPPPPAVSAPHPDTLPAPAPRLIKPAAVRSHVPAAPDTAARPGIRLVVEPDTAGVAPGTGTAGGREGGGGVLRVALGRAVPDAPAVGPAPKVCECRVKGTVEVRSDRALPGTLRVVVSLADAPAIRDTVDLFMGPPRPFDLGRVPCGIHRLGIEPLSAKRYVVRAPGLDAFDCAAGWSHQVRVILEPR